MREQVYESIKMKRRSRAKKASIIARVKEEDDYMMEDMSDFDLLEADINPYDVDALRRRETLRE